MSSTILSSTALSASNLRLQRPAPSGGVEQANAVIFACCLPLNIFGAPDLGLSFNALSRPPWTYRLHVSLMVVLDIFKISAISYCDFLSLASNKIRQRFTLRALIIPDFVKALSVFSSLFVNFNSFILVVIGLSPFKNIVPMKPLTSKYLVQ